MTRWAAITFLVCLPMCVLGAGVARAQPAAKIESHRSIANRNVEWPAWEQWRRVFLLEDYNTRVVLLGTTLLGCAAGMVGSFTLLRKRALMGDALSHATLPGIGLAFIVATSLGGNGKSLPVLLAGATATGLIGMGAILLIRRATRLKEDAALGAVLSVFFGAGISLLGVVQQMKEGHAAGLEAFIYGKTASMGANDALLIAAAALVCIGTCVLLFKEFKLLCFDEAFAGSRGLPVLRLDVALMALVVIITIVGLQAVGLILMIALLVTPAAAARFWTEKMWRMIFVSGALGAASGMIGAGMSALFSKLPSGAMIVLVCAALFLISMLIGSPRGVFVRWFRRSRLNRTVDRQHLLRAMHELLEASAAAAREPAADAGWSDLLAKRSWSPRTLQRAIRHAVRDELVQRRGDRVRLTAKGVDQAAKMTRQHRLWELYLIRYADIAPSRVDREADAIEHVLEPDVIAELESLHAQAGSGRLISPHALALPRGDANHSAASEREHARVGQLELGP